MENVENEVKTLLIVTRDAVRVKKKNALAEWELIYLSISAKGDVIKLEPSCCARLRENLLKGSWLILDFFYYWEDLAYTEGERSKTTTYM